jgi:uncharacterized membrane-anchored protein YhcB (DUF1043 family)
MDSGSPDDPSKATKEQATQNTGRKFRIFGVLLAIGMIVGTGEGIYAWRLASRLQDVESKIQAQITVQDASLHHLRDRMGDTEEQFADLQGDFASTKDHLGKTQGDLRKTRQVADQLAKEQKETAEHLTGQLSDLQQAQMSTSGTVGSLSSDVTGVKQEVSLTKQDLASTRSELQRVIGDLGVQSGLVAHNRDDLAELRLRGERDYFEFDLRKSSRPQKYVNGVALQLKNADMKRQKYTVDLISDDRTIQKKDKNTNEPVQFYQQGNRVPTEIVVNQIYKDRIVGYISMPKQRQASAASVEGAAQTSASGS